MVKIAKRCRKRTIILFLYAFKRPKVCWRWRSKIHKKLRTTKWILDPSFFKIFQITFRDIFLLNSKALKRAYAAPTAVLKKPGLIERILLGKSHQEAIHKFPIDENWKIMCWLLFSSRANIRKEFWGKWWSINIDKWHHYSHAQLSRTD